MVRSLAPPHRRIEPSAGGGDPLMRRAMSYVDLYLADYAHINKASSLNAQTKRLRRFRRDFSGRSLDITRSELKEWIHGEGRWSHQDPIPKCELTAIISLYNHASMRATCRLSAARPAN
jgi:hypothetical protein